MVSQIIKKNIRLLSEKFNHEISYYENGVLIKSEKNFIEIIPQHQKKLLVKYNIEDGIDEVEILDFEIYDLLINIFRRKELETIALNLSFPLNLKDLEEEFGDLNKFEEYLMSLVESNTDYINIGGNRVLTEFYKNTLILRDDIGHAKSNVINLSNDKI
ncbi:hypothetical protein BBI01_16950 [Chryseobacterium artocarpi]|uniref:Uncharacterized protein n=1 Tax=Chryseobacterium artocarpi TaxID=1414727 RepID=A0A1B8ZDV9_9FLAO|nr:hypothetical protein [Chryseobacterium artocarpi]OCA69808.1 hypothetical protein BBI01_16950 [Chryseobacterium artocarpi]